ncbi:formate dehydrogenase accessory sulfurtransferase FdhD [Acetobacter cibinongensis]|uniref:formate dehydrogenase accessory sulfurtransferase FdhD n=1 Tax=Acetobacter cibinongensis TaxID=146475 RepID=UPI000A36114F|nr:formate dehydrogenase accessory sulfurtransferase FdhD [Acetobacter cibinongensis]
MPDSPLVQTWPVQKLTETEQYETALKLADETPVAFVFNAIPYAVMMATYQDIEDYAYGFSITERIVSHASSIRSISIDPASDGITVHVSIQGEDFKKLLQSRRAMTGRTGCGICGSEDLESLHTQLPQVVQKQPITITAIRTALASLAEHQTLNAQVHMVHGAAWCCAEGRVQILREDVGRHNALDKLIGAGLRNSANFSDGFCLITSRCSYEMVQKAILAGFTTLVAISAPTTRALRLAQQAGLTIVALARTQAQFLFTGNVA